MCPTCCITFLIGIPPYLTLRFQFLLLDPFVWFLLRMSKAQVVRDSNRLWKMGDSWGVRNSDLGLRWMKHRASGILTWAKIRAAAEGVKDSNGLLKIGNSLGVRGSDFGWDVWSSTGCLGFWLGLRWMQCRVLGIPPWAETGWSTGCQESGLRWVKHRVWGILISQDGWSPGCHSFWRAKMSIAQDVEDSDG